MASSLLLVSARLLLVSIATREATLLLVMPNAPFAILDLKELTASLPVVAALSLPALLAPTVFPHLVPLTAMTAVRVLGERLVPLPALNVLLDMKARTVKVPLIVTASRLALPVLPAPGVVLAPSIVSSVSLAKKE